MADERDIFVFDYGTSPRRPEEESVGGDWSRSVAVAAAIREALHSELPDLVLSDPEPDDEWGAVVWVRGKPNKISVEPVSGEPFTWSVRFVQFGGCVGGLVARRAQPDSLGPIKDALDRVTSKQGDQFRNRRWLGRRAWRREFGR